MLKNTNLMVWIIFWYALGWFEFGWFDFGLTQFDLVFAHQVNGGMMT